MRKLRFDRITVNVLVLAVAATAPVNAQEAEPAAEKQSCMSCHRDLNPGIVNDWELSKHAGEAIECGDCHGYGHTSETDVAKVSIPTPETCAECHPERVEEYAEGKHALAWVAAQAMPTTHGLPPSMMDGMKGCGGCHKLGLKTESEIQRLKVDDTGFGVASCDACHTRHTFSVKEARDPQACRTCHMGFDHAQWEMYSGSKHGVRYSLKQAGLIPETAAAPTCQTCHMREGNHAVNTAWGFLAVRLPMPEDPQWAADRATIMKALGVLDPNGEVTGRLDRVKNAKMAKLTHEEWQSERDKMTGVCIQCHSINFATSELDKGDDIIRTADHLMAEAIRIVAGLYEDGVLAKPAEYAHAYPDLLAFQDAPTSIEQTLWVMFLEHRMRAFQGAFHANPDYSFWYGYSEMVRDLTEIREEAAYLREKFAQKTE